MKNFIYRSQIQDILQSDILQSTSIFVIWIDAIIQTLQNEQVTRTDTEIIAFCLQANNIYRPPTTENTINLQNITECYRI